MTIPAEEQSTLERVRLFLLDLCDNKVTPRIPLDVRKRAANLLRHYPMRHRIDELYRDDPKQLGYAELRLNRANMAEAMAGEPGTAGYAASMEEAEHG